MAHKTIISLILASAALTQFAQAANSPDWGQVQEAGRQYYQVWRSGDKAKAAEALKHYESLATAAYAAEKSGKIVPTTLVKPSEDLASGKRIYEASCQACHGAGIAGAPKVGDRAAWAPRLAQGQSVLVNNAIAGVQGKTGVMPARGGSTASDADIKAAVAYMSSASK